MGTLRYWKAINKINQRDGGIVEGRKKEVYRKGQKNSTLKESLDTKANC